MDPWSGHGFFLNLLLGLGVLIAFAFIPNLFMGFCVFILVWFGICMIGKAIYGYDA